MRVRKVWWYAFLVLLAGSSYGIVSTIMKVGYDQGFTVEQATDAQYLVGVVFLWIIALLWPGNRRIAKSQWWVLVVIALTSAGSTYAYYLALTHLPASLGIVLLFQFTWMVVLIDILVTKQWPPLQKWLGLAFICSGTVLAVGLFDQSISRFSMWAVLCGLLSGLGYAITLYVSGYADPGTNPAFRSALTATIAAAAIFTVFHPTSLLQPGLWHRLWPWALISGLFAQVIPLSLMLIAIPHTGGRMAGVLGSIELPVAVMSAAVFLHEDVSPLRWAGVVMILAGIVVSELDWERRLVEVQRDTA
jgi:drug/metabolite transporter (DMT)-like permease